jgi:hypothetical protein
MKPLSLSLAFALAACIALTGCGKRHDRASEKFLESSLSSEGARVDVSLDTPGEQITISTQTGEGTVNMSVGGQTQVPQNFPEDVPIIPNMQVLLAHEVVEQESFTLQGIAQQPVAQVSAFYRAEVEKQGWKQETATNFRDMDNYIFRKGPRMLTISIVSSQDTTSVTLTVTRE